MSIYDQQLPRCSHLKGMTDRENNHVTCLRFTQTIQHLSYVHEGVHDGHVFPCVARHKSKAKHKSAKRLISGSDEKGPSTKKLNMVDRVNNIASHPTGPSRPFFSFSSRGKFGQIINCRPQGFRFWGGGGGEKTF